MKKKGIQFYIDSFLKTCTEERKNRYEAHLCAHPFLFRLAQEGTETIFEVLKMAMLRPGFFQRKEAGHSFQINLTSHPEHEFYCSFFAPLETRETTHSYSPMHTHGEYMLSTVNAFGNGYTSLIWQKGWTKNNETGEVDMKLQKFCRHKHLNIEFMDANTAHTIFYPEKLCITYAFWTHCKPTNVINKLRSTGFVRKNKEVLKKMIRAIAPSPQTLGIVVHKEDYFYPQDGKLYAGSDREVQPEVHTFPQNFFSVLQEMEFKDHAFIENLGAILPETELAMAKPWIAKFLSEEKIPVNYEGYNTHHPRRNVHIDEFKKIYEFSLEE